MSILPQTLYAQWRTRNLTGPALQEAVGDSTPSERLLQLIWHYQRLVPGPLRLLDGEHVSILHPGFWNREAGPDFRGAVIRIGNAKPKSGDIEIDLHPNAWKSHGHDGNPAYKSVILHVIWDTQGKISHSLPTLVLKSCLDSSVGELAHWLAGTPAPTLSGQCSAPLSSLPASLLEDVLRQAGLIRLHAKAAEIQARARHTGWEQCLWERLFGALGYKQNTWPMRRIAEQLPAVRSDEASRRSPLAVQSLLFGVSGLLPDQLTGTLASTDNYVRQVWDCWWRERDRYADAILPASVWRFNGLRPANHPQRRLALAAHWAASKDFYQKLEEWFTDSVDDDDLLSSLAKLLEIKCDEFWSWHWTFRSRRTSRPQPLIGPQRVTDLAMNIILPWFWIRAVAGKNESLQHTAEHRYFAWPKAEDNAVLRLIRQRLFGKASLRWLNTAAKQQALLQIARDFCDHSNALCEQCPFPDLVRQLQT